MQDSKKDLVALFLYIGVAVSLVVAVINGLLAAFTVIDFILPADTSTWHSVIRYGVIDRLPVNLAFLLVAFGVLLCLSVKVKLFIVEGSGNIWHSLRHAIVMFIATAAGITIAVSLAIILSQFIGGDLSLNSFIDFTLTAVLGWVIFYYYRGVLKNYWATHKDKERSFAILVGLFTLLIFIAGVWVVNPFDRLDVKETHQTLESLDNISRAVNVEYAEDGKLLENLQGIDRNEYRKYSGFLATKSKDVRYEKIGGAEYRLCADFAAFPRGTNFPDYPYSDFEIKQLGETCFDFVAK